MSARTSFAASAAIATLAAAWGVPAVQAQQTHPVTRTVLLKHDLRAQGQEGVMALVEIPPGEREGRHSHPGELFVYVIEGTATFDAEGKPTATYRAGESFFVEPGKIHEAINNGTAPLKAVSVVVIDKGKPLTTQTK
jgi:quercetin dioxygenase-like cupin family protein